MLFQANVMQVHMAVAYISELRSKTGKKTEPLMIQILILGKKATNINLRKCNFKLPTRKYSGAGNIFNVVFLTNAQWTRRAHNNQRPVWPTLRETYVAGSKKKTFFTGSHTDLKTPRFGTRHAPNCRLVESTLVDVTILDSNLCEPIFISMVNSRSKVSHCRSPSTWKEQPLLITDCSKFYHHLLVPAEKIGVKYGESTFTESRCWHYMCRLQESSMKIMPIR